MLTTKQIKKDLKKLSKKQLIERVMIWINRSSNLATNLNRLEREVQKNDSMNDSKHQDMLDLESTISRLRGLLKTYQELAGRGCEGSIEVMAEKLHDFCLQDTNDTIALGVKCGYLKILDYDQELTPWNISSEETKDTYRVHVTKIITKDCQQ